MLRTLSALLLALSLLCKAEPIGFNSHIRPLLSDHCFACHGFDPSAREADLRLDTQEGAFADRKSGTGIVPGNLEKSLIWQRIISTDPDDVMPPADHHLKLDEKEKKLIQQWIQEGAKYEEHWTFIPVKKPPISNPEIHPIDSLVIDKLKSLDLQLSPLAGKETLIRRLSFDLRGLPPTTQETAAFLADTSPQAWGKLIDSFLADPAFGERFAWPWLDAARYADSNGFQGDAERTMWPWRDWVIDAINRNLPYDDFTIWQIAGDLLPNPTHEQKLATGFLRNHAINGEGGAIIEENRVNYVFDMAETVGTVWMGLTFNCCRCHDHKYDPLSQKDYYSLTAFFNQTPITGGGGDPQTKPVLALPTKKETQRESELKAQVTALKKEHATLAATLNPASLKTDPPYLSLTKKLSELEKQHLEFSKKITRVMIMADQKKRRKTYVLAVGSYEARGETVDASTPGILPPLTSDAPLNRLDLAKWLVARNNPLTSRTTINRLWQELFGIGLIKSPEDLGVQSEVPIHPQLLDWLSADFMDSGWDFKKLIKTIVTSQVYQQSSKVDSLALERDPKNRHLARASRYRLPSWMIRDQALALADRLAPQIGGKPVKPYQPAGLWAESTFGKKTYLPDTGENLRRRSIYTFWRRISAPAMVFDNAKREGCEVGSYRTNSPLHALAILNDPHYLEAARAIAYRAHQLDPATPLRAAFQIITTRPPLDHELTITTSMYDQSRTHFEKHPEDLEKLLNIGDLPISEKIDHLTQAALTSAILSLLNTDEALTKE